MLIVVAALVAVLVAGFAVSMSMGRARMDSGSMATPMVAPSMPDFASGGSGTASSAASGELDQSSSTGLTAKGGAAAPAPAQAPAQGVPVGDVGRSLVRTAQLSVEVKDLDAATRQVRTAAAANGGFVTEEKSGTSGSWVVLRVPSDKLDALIDAIAPLGKVTGRNAQVVDATEQVVDLDARVSTQQASVARVRALLGQATSIGDVVSIESELSRREADLDSLTRRLSALKDKVALSSLTVDMRAPGSAATTEDPGTGGFLDGLAGGWDGLMKLGAGVGVVVGFLLPFVPVFAVLFGIGWLIRRLVRARRVPAAATSGAAGGTGAGPDQP
ncbi:DUF4349 domain-containing protein [Pseudonocardia sp. GCM10023141]|uniref:DUF4349 domain-containing protein n=1 Tax=Pseudonocardia sp. GCM10023141 TaxID=3252653 RepID=UPI0036D25A85